MIRDWVSAAIVGLAALGAAGAAQATQGGVPPAFLGPVSETSSCMAGSNSAHANPCNFGGAQATVFGAPFATAQASASGPAAGGLSDVSAMAHLQYDFTVDGPTTDPIEVDISANLITSASLGSAAFATFTTSLDASACAQTSFNTICDGHAGADFHGVLTALVTPGQVYLVILDAEADEDGSVGGTAFASADPFIGIDPLDANADLYSVRVSDGVVNGTPSVTPEPESWALLLLGFGGLGAAVRSQRRRVASAA